MAGLDTRGAFDGFVQGFGMMQNYRDGQDRKEYMKQQQGMQERGMEMREQEFSAQQDERQKQQDQREISQFYEGWSNGIEAPITPELEKVFSRNSMADPRHLFKPETEAAVQYADKLSKGEGSLFSNETVTHIGNYYAPRINRGSGGQKKLIGMYPGQKEGTFSFELEVTPETGLKYKSPMTVNRGIAGEDDEVAQYSIEDAIKPVMGAKSIYQALGENREKMMSYLQASGYIKKPDAKWEEVKGPGGSILQRNTATGEMKNVLGRAPIASTGGGAAFAPSSDVKTIEYLISQGMTPAEARDEVVRLKRGSTGDSITASDRYKVTYLTNQIKEIDSFIASSLPLPDERAKLEAQRAQLVQQRENIAGQLGLIDPPQQAGPIAGKVYSDANGNKARWNGSEYVPVDAGGNR